MKTNIYSYHISLILQRIKNSSDKNCIENEAHILCSIKFFFFRKSGRLWDNVEKYYRAEEATVDNMAHTHCILDT